MPGAQCTRSLVCAWCSKYAHEYSQRVAPEITTAIPARNGFNGFLRAISPVIGLSCHRHCRTKGRSAPGWADLPSDNLTAGVEASGPHDFTVRNRVLSSACLSDRSRIVRPALQSRATPNAAASTASRPASVTIAIRPLCGTRRRSL